jgi:hypothetical protein
LEPRARGRKVALGESTRRRSELWLQADAVVHGTTEPLLAAEVALCRLHRNMAQEKLDLLKFAAGGVA